MNHQQQQRQQQNQRLRTYSSRSQRGVCVLAFYWRQIFALDSAVVKTQKWLSSHGGFLLNAMHHHKEKSNQISTL